MGTLSGGNGGGWPPDELPDLPPEWGTIVIPDDASELARDAARVRRELRRGARGRRWRRRLHLPPAPPRRSGDDTTTLGVPLLVISIAVIATLTSLFAIAWPTKPQQPMLHPSTAATTPVQSSQGAPAAGPSATGTSTPHALSLPDVALYDPAGVAVHLRGSLPAVVLLVDGCDCAQLVAATATAAAAVSPKLTTVAVGTTAIPTVIAAPTAHLRAVEDPGRVLRTAVPGDGHPSALLVRADAVAVRVVTAVSTVDDFRADLAKLAA